MTDVNALGDALARYGPFVVRQGVDYIELEQPDGMPVENIVVTSSGVIWGSQDEHETEADLDPVTLAKAILLTLKDVA